VARRQPIPLRLFLAALLAAAGLPAGCTDKHAPAAAPDLPVAAVRVQTVERKTHVATEEVIGTVRAKLRAVIEAKVSGTIRQMLVAPGQSVKAGELLARLDAREIQARLDQAQALREQADRDLERFRALLGQKAITRQEFDNVQARHRVATAAVTEVETMLGYTRVTAPFDGLITRKHADVGDLAAPGKPLLEIEDTRALRLEADMPEAAIGGMALGARLRVRVATTNAEIEGVVSEIAPAADPLSRTFLVKLDLPAAPGLRAGQFGRVAVPVGESQALRVPAGAVVQRGQMELVFVVAGQRARLRLVKTGKRLGDDVELVSGVSAGEQVVVAGAASLADGQPVEVR
jgi:RND family efflux transporter MFP subunit